MASSNSGEQDTSKSNHFYGAFKSGLCFICLENYSETSSGSESENIILKLPLSLSPEQQSVAAVSALSKNDLAVYFTLKHIIELPEDNLKSYLQQCPHPDRWLKICSDCSETYAKKCKRIFMELVEVQAKFSGARLELIEAVKRSSQKNVRNEKSVANTSWEIRDFIKHHEYKGCGDTSAFTIGNSMVSELLAAQKATNELNVYIKEYRTVSNDENTVEDNTAIIVVNEKDKSLSGNAFENITAIEIKENDKTLSGNAVEEDNCKQNEITPGSLDDISISEEFDEARDVLIAPANATEFSENNKIQEEEENQQDSNGNEEWTGNESPAKSVLSSETDSEDEKATEKTKNHSKTKNVKSNRNSISNDQKKKTISCVKCGFKCLKSDTLDFHIKTKHGGSAYHPKSLLTCEICQKLCKNKVSLYSHMKCHKKTAHCQKCDKSFPYRSKLIEHMRCAHGEATAGAEKFVCTFPGCNRWYWRKTTLNVHFKFHLPPTEFCHICGKGYHINRDLRRHVEMHETKVTKPFMCEMCPAKFGNKFSLASHIKHIHKKREDSGDAPIQLPSSCPICNKTYKCEKQMKRHIKEKHEMEKVCCELCGQSLIAASLKSHMKNKHENPTPFPCPREGCKRSFRSEFFLQRHMLIHKDSAPICDHCGKAFSTEESLKHHVVVMHSANRETKPFICELCGKGFAASKYLRYHIRHTHQKYKRKRTENVPK